MRKKVSHKTLIKDFEKQYIDSGMFNIPPFVVDLVVSSYLESKLKALKAGDIVVEPIGESRITIRRTNSTSNNGLSAKIVTVLDKKINREVCESAFKDSDYFQLLRDD